jgi:hypothetical protein
MNKRLCFIIMIIFCSMQNALAYVPSLTTSARPTLRPDNLNMVPSVKDGVFQNGVMKLTLSFYDRGIFYQRNQTETLIPIVYYLKNEFPKVDFSQIKMTSINVHTRSLGEPALTRFYNKEGELLSEYFIPKIQYPGEVFGDFTNAKLEHNQLDNLLYLGLSGVQNINNITAYFVEGLPNFSVDLNSMPLQGQPVGELEGYQRPSFDQLVFQNVMSEVDKMTSLGSFNNNNREDLSDLSNQISVDYPIGKIGLFSSTNLTFRLKSGQGNLKGYKITRRNGSSQFISFIVQLDSFKQIDIKLKSRDSRGTITFIFSSLSSNATTTLLREAR